MSPFVLTLSDPHASLEMVGGKGMSLAKLVRAGLPVPDGFHVTTSAYREFVHVNGLQPKILQALETVDAILPASLEGVSQRISRFFTAASIPDGIGKAILECYAALAPQHSSPASVAVRSSATAEDLPDASFAGQQDTYLNIKGSEAVLEAVRKCWASLWTGRAIAYRLRQGISPESVALAVVVQLLVPAEAAGIMFTMDPVTGDRGQVVVNAAWGLGEAVVGGLVTPDMVAVDKAALRVVRRETAEKQVMTIRTNSGTEEQPVPDSLKNKSVLDDAQAAELAGYGIQIEKLYNIPMDIEWTLAEGKFAIVQARPITTLGQAPLEWKPPLPDGVYMRTSLVDLMPDPLSPLFGTLGIPALAKQVIPVGRILTRAEPVLPEGYFSTINGYAYMNAHFPSRSWAWILFHMLPSYPRMLRTMVSFWREQAHPGYQKAVVEWNGKDVEKMSAPELWQGTQSLMNAAAYYAAVLQFATMGVSAGSEGMLTRVYEKMVRREGDPPASALLMGWNNLPMRAEKSLYDLARYCREHEQLSTYICETGSTQLAEELAGRSVPAGIDTGVWTEFRQRFQEHLEAFGHMIFELDVAKPLPRDHPEPMLEAIKMYLRGEGTDPYERQKSSEERRIRTADEAKKRLRGFRRWLFIKMLTWAQSQSEVREDALAEIGIGYPLMRRMLHLLGERCVQAGAIEKPEDIFWLEKDEVDGLVTALDGHEKVDCQSDQVSQRRAYWKRLKAVTPPPMIPFKKRHLGFNTAIWLAESEGKQPGKSLKGVAASPGRVTATARVLHGPEDFNRMHPGDVLVAGTTTPAWTPLFSMAAAVVTDIGGPLSHGSIVAREYGIPAVMGTGVATRRIQDGQTITVDGGVGIVLLE